METDSDSRTDLSVPGPNVWRQTQTLEQTYPDLDQTCEDRLRLQNRPILIWTKRMETDSDSRTDLSVPGPNVWRQTQTLEQTYPDLDQTYGDRLRLQNRPIRTWTKRMETDSDSRTDLSVPGPNVWRQTQTLEQNYPDLDQTCGDRLRLQNRTILIWTKRVKTDSDFRTDLS